MYIYKYKQWLGKLSLAIIIICSSCILITAQNNRLPQQIFSSVNKRHMNHWVDSVFRSLSPEEQLGQLIMPIIYPSEQRERIDQVKKSLLEDHWGGILYQKGFLRGQAIMTEELQKCSPLPLLIALDGEWGLYMRLKDAPRFPRNMGLGFAADTQLIYNYGKEVARQCQLMGIHINFAPTVDVNINPSNPVIGTRSFGENPQIVSQLSVAYAQGLEDGGVLSVAKHFPGHGDTSEDSHLTLPVLNANKKRIKEVELTPFRSYINKGFGGIMTAHLRVPVYEPEPLPSSLSYRITTELLQEELGFRGLIFTDGLEMKGVQKQGRDIGVLALVAGNDILLGPENPHQMLQSLIKAYHEGILHPELIEEKCKKVLSYKYALIVSSKSKPTSPEAVRNKIFTPESQKLVDILWQKSLYFYSDPLEIRKGIDIKKYKRIGIVQVGKNPINTIEPLVELPQGVSIDYLIYNKGISLKGYDLIIANMFTTDSNILSSIQNNIGTTPLLLVYYTSPYQIPPTAFVKKSKQSLLIAFEMAREAQEAVLQLVGGIRKKIPSHTAGDGQTEEDPTAKMPSSVIDNISKTTTPILETKKLFAIDSLVNSAIIRGIFPGCQIVVYHRGNLIYNKAFGTLFGINGEHVVTKSTLYDVASVTKAFATTPALMLLVGKNKVRLDAPLQLYLPWLRNTEVGQIRIQELLLHESGLQPTIDFCKELWDKESEIFIPTYVSNKRDSIFNLPFARELYISNRFKSIIQKRLATLTVNKEKTYQYSDINFILLQQVIESVTTQSLDVYLQENIYNHIGAKLFFQPLNHGFSIQQIAPTEMDNKIRKQIVQGTVHDEAAACLGGISGNAGLFSSAAELAKVGELLRQRGMWKGREIIPSRIVDLFTQTMGKNERRYLGFDKAINNESTPTAMSASLNTYGHLGFTGTAVWVDPIHQITFVFLSNRTYPTRMNKRISTERIRPQLHQLVYDALEL